jgi:hypothetical protein
MGFKEGTVPTRSGVPLLLAAPKFYAIWIFLLPELLLLVRIGQEVSNLVLFRYLGNALNYAIAEMHFNTRVRFNRQLGKLTSPSIY